MTLDRDNRFHNILHQIASSENVDQMREVTLQMCNEYGLANIVYHALYIPEATSLNPIVIPTYDPEWIRRYINNDYFQIDPVVNSGKRGFLPLDWSSVDRESNTARSFFAEADSYGVGRQGITMPVRGPAGERALFTITANLSEVEWRSYRLDFAKEFQIISHFFHDQTIKLAGYRLAASNHTLSPREMECLQLTADGLVPKRIASRLAISASAVRLYLRSACRKLGCANIHQAVAKMVTLELLHPHL
jgi:DNA-binding CsgD family transcriptional regulator